MELSRGRYTPCGAEATRFLVECIGWYNAARLHEKLGDIPPIEYEQLHAPREANYVRWSDCVNQLTRSPSNPVRLIRPLSLVL